MEKVMEKREKEGLTPLTSEERSEQRSGHCSENYTNYLVVRNGTTER